MSNAYALELAAWGASTLAAAALVQAILAVLERVELWPRFVGWAYAFGWGAVMTGATMSAIAAWHFV